MYVEGENKELCSECSKSNECCCKQCGCHLSPDDINSEVTYDNVKTLLNTGNYSIDWWDDFVSPFKMGMITRAYYIRMRNIDSPIVDPSWGGQCKLLTDKGCPLEFKDRPKGARALIPGKDECKSYYEKYNAVEDWDKYHDILDKLYNEFL